MNHVQSMLVPIAVVPVLFLQHPHLCGTQGHVRTILQPQNCHGHGPFPVGKGSIKLLLCFSELLRAEHGVCSDRLVLQHQLTALKKRLFCQSCD